MPAGSDVLVSVIIPTYNWSSALRLSMMSVLRQTYQNFELLVIGDCCTDDSAEVALSFSDPRVQWRNLPTRMGSQSGPSNHGNAIARGAFIAYLGHDDVWHPDHLKSMVSRTEETAADVTCAVAVMYGPPGSGIRGVSGVFVEGQYRADDFFPPSSMMHRRDLIGRIGPWRAPQEISDPVDVDFLRRAYKAGAKIVSTERLTVFKFNAAWRRDSYIRRSVTEQAELLRRLEQDPSQCVEAEWAGMLQAVREKRFFEAQMPPQGQVEAGHYWRQNMRNRGLADAEAAPLLHTKRFSLDEQTSALDWHEVEHHPEWVSYRWTGPSPVAVAVLPVIAPPAFRVRIRILNLVPADVASEVTLKVAGQEVAFTARDDGAPALLLETGICSAENQTGALRIEIKVARLRSPLFHMGAADPRWLGVCVNWIEVEPAISRE